MWQASSIDRKSQILLIKTKKTASDYCFLILTSGTHTKKTTIISYISGLTKKSFNIIDDQDKVT